MSTRIKTFLDDLEKSVADVAAALRLPPATVDSWVRGTREPGFANGLRLARYLGVRPEEIAFGEEWLQGQIDSPATGRADVALATSVQDLTREVKRLGGRLSKLEGRDRSGRGQRQSGRPRA